MNNYLEYMNKYAKEKYLKYDISFGIDYNFYGYTIYMYVRFGKNLYMESMGFNRKNFEIENKTHTVDLLVKYFERNNKKDINRVIFEEQLKDIIK